MSVPNELRTQILALPRVDRAELAHDLLLSLDPGDEPFDKSAYDAAWAAELEERYRRFESGEEEAVPIEEALERAREVLRARRAERENTEMS